MKIYNYETQCKWKTKDNNDPSLIYISLMMNNDEIYPVSIQNISYNTIPLIAINFHGMYYH